MSDEKIQETNKKKMYHQRKKNIRIAKSALKIIQKVSIWK